MSLLFKEGFTDNGDNKFSTAAKDNHIYMDAMGFGMGCCCLQLTFQACNIQEARTLYDQLTPLCPIMVSVNTISLLDNFHFFFFFFLQIIATYR